MTLTVVDAASPPPVFERCRYVDGRCTTWSHQFRADHHEGEAETL